MGKTTQILLVILVIVCAVNIAFADTISGRIQYENKLYNVDGFTGATESLPVRYAVVEVTVGTNIYSTSTDGLGNYTVSVPNSGTQSIKVSVYAYQNNASFNIAVKDNNTSKATYVVSSSQSFLNTDLPIDMDVMKIQIGSASGAFNIFDMGIWTYEFLGTLSPLPSPLPKLTFYWESDSTIGTIFVPSENAIYLTGTSSDPDEFDDDIILHEIGHFIAFNFSKDDSPGGTHSVTGQYDPRLAWSEGWANFWSCAVRDFAGSVLYPTPQVIVDNFGTGSSSFDIGLPSSSTYAIMATNELAVAYCLWHIYKQPLEMGISPIWKVINLDIPSMKAITLEDFFKGWQNRVDSGILSETQEIFYSRSIKYFSDKNEANNQASNATTISDIIRENTIFPAGDVDYFKFTAYAGDKIVLETTNLGDGADTFMTLYSTDGISILATSDDVAEFDKSSKIEYTVPIDGTYFAKVNAYTADDQITEFGFYDIRLSINPTNNIAPSISASANPQSGTAPLIVNFDISASDSDGYITRYEWDFDGDGAFDFSSSTTGKTSFTYETSGTFSAVARVFDNRNTKSSQTITINVEAPSQPSTGGSGGGGFCSATVILRYSNDTIFAKILLILAVVVLILRMLKKIGFPVSPPQKI
jgi:hypothetical protein